MGEKRIMVLTRGAQCLIAFVLVLVVVLSGCGGVSVRDPVVYETELDFIAKASDEQSKRMERLIEMYCRFATLSSEDKELAFTMAICEESAGTLQVVKARMPWHIDMMKYLGGIKDERPAKDPPKVPPGTDLCPVKKTNPYGFGGKK